MFKEEGKFSILELQLISELLYNVDESVRLQINGNIQRFIEVVKEYGSRRGMRWDDLALIFEWTFERDRIFEFFKSTKTPLKERHI
jgi:hypothetical protein